MSDYPRMLYHPDGGMKVAQSAHHEHSDEFKGYTREPHDKHRNEPANGSWTMARPADPVVDPATGLPTTDAPGPVDAGTVRRIIREEMQAHPGLNTDGMASAEDVAALHDKIDALMEALGVEAAGEPEAGAPVGDQPKRRGRPPKNPQAPDNRLTATQE
ncbi:hypothetical protein [Methylobacterium sp. yr596]|uniref:hypothetical protein n=1 Tax=Methylobacterium sp. yr596 TaxID=1761800 RepID=UPI0008E1EE71|nr:hypothetical protein [Methylobacterium sp. yr596]SFF76807.1 hypothetical protein SAMN04487844_14715 [Methylobacterium sp. yr596]